MTNSLATDNWKNISRHLFIKLFNKAFRLIHFRYTASVSSSKLKAAKAWIRAEALSKEPSAYNACLYSVLKTPIDINRSFKARNLKLQGLQTTHRWEIINKLYVLSRISTFSKRARQSELTKKRLGIRKLQSL